MNATYNRSLQSRLAAGFLAFVASAVVLGSTLAGFQPPAAESTTVVLDRVTVRATNVN